MSSTDELEHTSTGREQIECDGVCGDTVRKSQTIDVVAGAVIGEWDDPRPHIGVTGTTGGLPVHDRYCADCAQYEFDIDTTAQAARQSTARKYITVETTAAFTIGVLLALTLAMLFIV